MDLGFNLAQSNRDLKDPTSRQNFGDTSGLLCKNDPILRLIGAPHPLRHFSSAFKDFLQTKRQAIYCTRVKNR